MSDRTLLENAARAAGVKFVSMDNWPHQDGCRFWSGGDFCDCGAAWDPLTDDGDALRLAVELGFSIITEPYYIRIHSIKDVFLVREEVVCDGFAATRRAIVRAAAAIGEGLK